VPCLRDLCIAASLLQLQLPATHSYLPHTKPLATIMSQLSYARYGKDNVRLYKVDKDPKTGIHTIVEQTVRILLEGDIDVS
jgi:hypothetical protein